jgi:hypothetical protein
LAPGNGKTKTGRLWTYVRDDRPAAQSTPAAVWFAYSEDRKGEHPRQHLKDYTGALQADAYSGLHHLYSDGRIYEVGCWAHARRKFHDIHVTHRSATTTEALSRIGALYAIEEQVRGKPPDLRCSVRQAQAKPILDDLRLWMEKMLRSLSAKSDTAGAIRYALSHWRALTRYVDDGLLEIDNSSAERALRAVSIGRKNYLFFGADSGGVRAASFYTLIGTAKLNGHRSTSATFWPASQNIRSIASPNSCPGTWPPNSNPHPHKQPKRQIGVRLFKRTPIKNHRPSQQGTFERLRCSLTLRLSKP